MKTICITGSLTLDLVAMVKHYIKGIKYNMQVDPYDEALGIVEMKIGQVKYNLYLLFKSIVLNTIHFCFSFQMNQII